MLRTALSLYHTVRNLLVDAWRRTSRDVAVALWQRSYRRQEAAAAAAERHRYQLARFAWSQVAAVENVEKFLAGSPVNLVVAPMR